MSSATQVPGDMTAAAAASANVFPVVTRLAADLHTPASAYLRIAAGAESSFLFESVERGERVGRYSFIGARPHAILRGRGGTTTITDAAGAVRTVPLPATEVLREHFSCYRLLQDPSLPPFTGGAVGYLGYEAARWFEPALNFLSPRDGANDAVVMLYRTIAAFDHVKQQMVLTTLVFADETDGTSAGLARARQDAAAVNDRLARVLESAMAPLKLSAVAEGAPEPLPITSNWPRADFENAVRSVQEHIAAGDCYQAVLSRRIDTKVSASAVDIYRALRATNPSPYMFLFCSPEEAVIGSSPEMLVRCRGRLVEYSPIAGTRPRSADREEDERLAEELRNDEKETAEHIMLVDLGRNDVGRVSEYGSIEVESLMAIEKYSHVQHLVTRVSGTLREGLTAWDALASCFPAGTVSGAPKIRAMQIIHELEPEARGVYAGAVLYGDYAGNLDSCITIRTVHLRDGVASVQAGAGIVADSVPSCEYEETSNKAQALLSALSLAVRS